MKYFIFVLAIIVVILVFIIVRNIIRKKNVNKCLSNGANKYDYELVKATKRGYDYILRTSTKDIYLKVDYIPKHSQVCINAKETWKLSWSSVKQDKGKSYPNNRYMTELENFLKNDIQTKNTKECLKVIFLYKRYDSIIRYLNETELDTIDITKSPYGYKITSYDNFDKDIEEILK